jgi:predicted PurR-regulated permease PerM
MMVFFFILLSIFSLVVFYLNQQFVREQKGFEQRMEALQKNIVELNQQSILQNHKIQLTEELDKTLQTSKSKLGTMTFNLYEELFELLSKNNLLKS